MYVGLDYHDKMIQVCGMDGAGALFGNRSCGNAAEELLRQVKRFTPSGATVSVVLESCNGAANLADELHERFDWEVSLAHPGYVSRMRQNRDKTDWSDARLLADLLRVGYLPRVWLAPKPIRELRQVVSLRQQLAREQRNIKLQIGALLRQERVKAPARTNRWTLAWLDWLRHDAPLSEAGRFVIKEQLLRLQDIQKRRARVEAKLGAMTASDATVQKLLSLKGIGLITAVVMRAKIGRFDRFHSGKQLSRFCGVSPRNASSGERQADAGLIDACDRELRTVVIELAHQLKRYDPRWRELAERLRAAGKKGSVIAAAVGNRFMRWLYHEMTERAELRP